jgi:hypothetical protein
MEQIKRRVQQFFYSCMCMFRNDCNRQLRTNDNEMNTKTQRLMGEMYKVYRLDWIKCNDMRTKFRKNCFRRSRDRIQRRVEKLISLFFFTLTPSCFRLCAASMFKTLNGIFNTCHF